MNQILYNDFPLIYNYKEYFIEFIGLTEMGQGGPLIGQIKINGKIFFPDKRFSGPLIFDSDFMYAPLLDRSFSGNRFKISQIDLPNKILKTISQSNTLYCLRKQKKGKFTILMMFKIR